MFFRNEIKKAIWLLFLPYYSDFYCSSKGDKFTGGLQGKSRAYCEF